MTKKTAKIYRMKTNNHICSFGLRAKALLKKKGYLINDNLLKTTEEVDYFKRKHDVKTTPQIFIDDKRIGGLSDLEVFFGKKTTEQNEPSYGPIAKIFGATLLIALTMQTETFFNLNIVQLVKQFFAFSMCVLAILKIRDSASFVNQFITYDLLAMRFLAYGSLYPFLELLVGLGMLSNLYPFAIGILSFSIGLIGSTSVVKAVYFEKRDLRCACVGGNSNVPLGFVSLVENFMMIAMGLGAIFSF